MSKPRIPMPAGLSMSLLLIRIMLERPGYKLRFLLVWIIIFVLFIWLPRINLLSYILIQSPMSFNEKASFMARDIGQLVVSLINPIVLSMLLFTLLAALSIMLIIFSIRTGKLLNACSGGHGKGHVSVATSAIGAHILHCGGTLILAPIFPALSGSATIAGGTGATVNLWLGTAANIVGILLVLRAINKTSKDMATMLYKSPG